MTNEEILIKAVHKALDNGWQIPFEEPLLSVRVETEDINGVSQLEPYLRFELDGEADWAVGIQTIIYDHDFAKALWGDGDEVSVQELPGIGGYSIHVLGMNQWEAEKSYLWYLQQMVIAEDPIKYLGENL